MKSFSVMEILILNKADITLKRDQWRLLGIIFLVIVGIAIVSAIVDWLVIGPLEGRVF